MDANAGRVYRRRTVESTVKTVRTENKVEGFCYGSQHRQDNRFTVQIEKAHCVLKECWLCECNEID